MQTNKQLFIVSLFLSGFLIYSSTIHSRSVDGGSGGSTSLEFYALDDVTSMTRDITTLSGNVLSNDKDIISASLIGSLIGNYGSLALSSDGNYVYTLFIRKQEVLDLDEDEFLTETFTYQGSNSSLTTTQATLTINIFGLPGVISDNVEIEPNGRSYLATALNSGKDIKGHLHHSGDQDWFVVQSSGDEIIHLEICPPGSSCFDEKSWVLYVFDGSKLDENEETFGFPLREFGIDTGRIYNTVYSNHLYLNYTQGVFDDSLIGVIDPCFGKTNSLDIGVGDGDKTYYVAISSPLERDGGNGCSDGTVILEEDTGFTKGGGTDFSGGTETEIPGEKTVEQYIAIFPKSDDQYQLLVSRTGVDPLKEDSVLASELSGNSLLIPKLKVAGDVYSVEFALQENNVPGSPVKMDLADFEKLDDAPSEFIASFDAETNIVLVPKYVSKETQKLYSLVFQFDPITGSLELIKASPL